MIISGYTLEGKEDQPTARSYAPHQFSNSITEPKKKKLFSLIPFYKKTTPIPSLKLLISILSSKFQYLISLYT